MFVCVLHMCTVCVEVSYMLLASKVLIRNYIHSYIAAKVNSWCVRWSEGVLRRCQSAAVPEVLGYQTKMVGK